MSKKEFSFVLFFEILMIIFRTISEYNNWRETLESKTTLGFVPTMGFLHQGHISLVSESVSKNAATVVSIFVNPTQFNNSEDLEKYPKNEVRDIEMLEKAGATAVFIPTESEMYPQPITENGARIDDVLEGAMRRDISMVLPW